MLLSIIKFFRGFVCVRLSGYAPERFLNLCGNRDIVIWNLERDGDDYEFYISVQAFRTLRPIAKKTRTKLVVKKRFGFPFWLHRYRRRKLFFGGILLFFLILILLSQFIWNIEINGNSYITDETVLAYLKEQDLSFGTPKKKIDAEKLEESFRMAFDDVIWTSVKISGTKMTIDLQENIKNKERERPNDGKAYDIIAEKDAVIDTVITRQGAPQITAGTQVKKGDVLILGRLEILGDGGEVTNYQYCVSDADITGVTTYPYEDSFPLAYEKKVPTGEIKKQYAISAFGYYLFIPSLSHGYEHAEKYTSEYQIHICSDFYLPFYFETNEYREYVPEDGIYKESEAKELAASHLLTYLEKLREKDVQIIQKNVMIEIDEKNCRASGNITVKEKIGTYAPTEALAVPAPEVPADEGINTQ